MLFFAATAALRTTRGSLSVCMSVYAGDTDARQDSLEAAIDDIHGRLGQDALQSGRVFTRQHRPERDPTRQRAALEKLDEEDDGPKQGPSDNAGKTSC